MNKSLALHHVQVAVIDIAWQFREGVKPMNQSEEQQELCSFFGSSLAHLEPELELFEVWEITMRQIIITIITKLQTALARFLDELERNQKKGKSSKYNFQNDGYIGSGPAVHI